MVFWRHALIRFICLEQMTDSRRSNMSNPYISPLTTQFLEETLPASHAPCFLGRAQALRFFALLQAFAAMAFYMLDQVSIALFFGVTASLLLFLLSCLYTHYLIQWRCMRQGAFLYASPKAQLSYALSPGSRFRIPVKLTNGLRSPLHVTQIQLLTTSHLSPETTPPFSLDPASVSEIEFEFTIIKRGPAAIYGVQFTFEDPWNFVRSSLLVAFQTNVDLHTAPASDAQIHAFDHARGTPADELDSLRPFQRGDRLKHIFWRGYAKTGELMTRVPTVTQPHCHVALLVDVSPMMSSTLPFRETHLHQWLPEAKACIFHADAVTLFACTSQDSRLLLKHARPKTAVSTLETVCLQQHLFCRPTLHEDWNRVVRILWKDLACYRNRDFTRIIDKRPYIDSPMMIQWIRYELAINHPKETRQISRVTDKTIATRYMRERRLEFDCPVPQTTARFVLAQKQIQTFRHDLRPQEIWCLTHKGLERLS